MPELRVMKNARLAKRSRTRGSDSGGLVAMATAQPAFSMAAAASAATATTASASDLVGGGSNSGGGGTQQGQQGVSPTATVTVVASPPTQPQASIVSANSVSITAVAHQTLQQNGSVDGSLDSPSDSSNGGGASNGSTAQVTAQVVVSSDTAAVNAGSSEQNGSAGGSQSATGTTTIVGSPHYITVTVSESDAVGSDTVAAQGVHPTYVQYVEGSADQAIYAATNGQMAYPVYTVGETGTMYTPASGQYYSGNTTAVTYSQVASSLTQGTTAGQLLAQGNGAYLIQQGVDPDTAHTLIAAQRASPQTVTADAGGVAYMVPGNTTTNPSSLDGDGHPNLSHATRVSPATVQWLLENYETAEGVSLPRSTLYNHYLRHCNEHKLDPVNAASFGKLIRSVFLGLRTRRLGTRGNSKYHYYGIRVKPGSTLNQLSEDGTSSAVRQQPSSQKRYKFLSGSGGSGSGSGTQKLENQYEQSTNHSASSNHSSSSPQHPHHHQYLGDGSGAIPDFPDIEFAPGLALPEDCTLEDVDTLRSIYREHCEAFLDAVVNLEFQTVESLWREFWRSQDNNNGDECEEEKYLSKTKLYLLCKCGPVQQFVRRVDYLFYQNLVEVLIPDVLRPIPSSLTQAIRNFAKGLESWLTAAMTGCPEEMMHIKVSAVSALAQTLRRYTSLNHLAQAARAVLQNSSQINQMLVDLNRVDFHNVQEQASWVCQCDDGMVQRLEADFKVTLQQQNSLEQWAAWLKGVVTQVLKPYEGKPNFAKAARQFLLKWSFYSSMVIRDLTLRSAASFGSFHLIRLLYDEYMFFLIEHQVALETGETPIAVMGEKYNNNPSSLSGYLQPGPCNGGVSLTMGVPVPVSGKMAPATLLVGSNEVSHHPVATKRLKIS
ncbi:DNA-binding protein RFX2-like isoform X2 [Periplaneta americana]|uniref:DNA-binding protein RFX2-like isoform X2 n=1 Tax=Periplaneta americana TaxID=6978 RepID=UPI0037E93519